MFWICRWMSGSHVMVPTNILGVMVPTNILRGSVHVLEMRKRKVILRKEVILLEKKLETHLIGKILTNWVLINHNHMTGNEWV
jgi:hypothetical protein